MTTGGEGGMALTNDKVLWEKMWSHKDHGKSYDAVFHREHPPGFTWLHEDFGTNWRMTEMQSAIGRSQLHKLPDWLEKRRKNAEILTKCLQQFDFLRITEVNDSYKHAYYKYYVFVKPEKLPVGWTRDRTLNELLASGVLCYSGSCSEIYLEKAFTSRKLDPAKRLPVAKKLGETSLMFLVHPTLDNDAMKEMCHRIEKTF